MGLTEEERRRTMPDRGDGNTVFARDAGLQRSETDDRMETERFELAESEIPHYDTEDIDVPFDHIAREQRMEAAAKEYGLEEDEHFGLDMYVGSWGIDLGRIARGEMESTPLFDRIAEEIIRGAAKFPRWEGRTYRNLGFDDANKYKAFLNEHRTGNVVVWNQFSSSSKDPNGYVEKHEYKVHIILDGYSGCDISESFSIPKQKEVLYLPGTAVKIHAEYIANDGAPILYMTEVRNNEKDTGRVYGREQEYELGRAERGLETDGRRERHDRNAVSDVRRKQGAEQEERNFTVREPDGVSAEVSGLSLPRLTEEPKIQNSFSPNTASDSDADTEAASALRDSITGKAREYMERAESVLMEKVGKALSIPSRTKEGRGFLQEISHALSEEYLREGRVAEEVRDRLFEAAYV